MKVNTDVGCLSMPDGCFARINYLDDGRYNEYQLTERLDSALAESCSKSSTPLFVDIGANVGYYTRFGAQRLYRGDQIPCADVISVEASMKNYCFLLDNIKGFDNILPFHTMAWNNNEHGVLYLDPNNCADNRSFGDGQAEEIVSKTRLDYILDFYEQVNDPIDQIVVKIDTQGSDHLALEGFGKYRDIISDCFVECWPFGMERLGMTMNDLLSTYRSWGFEVLPIEQPLEEITGDAYLNLHLKRAA